MGGLEAMFEAQKALEGAKRMLLTKVIPAIDETLSIVERGLTAAQFKQSITNGDLPDELMFRSIRDAGFSPRTLNCLVRGNIKTVGQLAAISEAELLELRNFGKTGLAEVRYIFGKGPKPVPQPQPPPAIHMQSLANPMFSVCGYKPSTYHYGGRGYVFDRDKAARVLVSDFERATCKLCKQNYQSHVEKLQRALAGTA